MVSIRLILADDHPPILQGLTLLLRQEPDFEVLAGCRDGEETMQAVRQFQPDVLILDILMPGKDGLAVLRELRQLKIPTRMILLTAAIDEDNLLEAMRLGVGAVVLKEMPVPQLIQCVREVCAGEQWFETRSFDEVLQKMLHHKVLAAVQGLMAEAKPIQIFLCHASEDKPAVLDIYDQLKILGYQPWLDKKELLAGQRWRVEIPKAIRASDFILIFLSRTSVAKRGYVQKEFKLALEVLDETPDGTITVIPVRLDDCPIPSIFGDVQKCDLFEADGLENLLRALQTGRPSLQGVALRTLQSPSKQFTKTRVKRNVGSLLEKRRSIPQLPQDPNNSMRF